MELEFQTTSESSPIPGHTPSPLATVAGGNSVGQRYGSTSVPDWICPEGQATHAKRHRRVAGTREAALALWHQG